jgi:hypothetical protein
MATENTPENSPLDVSFRKFKAHVANYPNKQLSQLLRGYLIPILEEMRFEYSDAFAYLEDQIDSDADPEVLEESKETVLMLAALLDAVLAKVGWIQENEIHESFPEDLREGFEQVKERVVNLLQSIEAAQDAEDDDEDTDEDTDEGDGNEATGEEATSDETPKEDAAA